MFAKVSILVASLLFTSVVTASDVYVSHAIERYLDIMQGIQMVEANSKPLYIQRALDGFKVARDVLEKYSTGEYQASKSDPKNERSKQIFAEIGLNGPLFVDNQEEMKLAVRLFVEANEESRCKQAVQELRTLFQRDSAKINELIEALESKCSE